VGRSVYPKQLAGNVVPGGWQMGAEGENEEEAKVMRETRKILNLPGLRMAVTCVRVPVRVGHAQAVFAETKAPLSAQEAREMWRAAPGMKVEDGEGQEYPTPLEVVGQDEVLVGRIRNDRSVQNGLAFWVVSDNLRKGAALNAVQIAEWAVTLRLLGRN
jgi:aspartate-semialdehyde dehydrogenase